MQNFIAMFNKWYVMLLVIGNEGVVFPQREEIVIFRKVMNFQNEILIKIGNDIFIGFCSILDIKPVFMKFVESVLE